MKKQKKIPFLPDKKTIKIDDFSPYWTNNKPEK